MEELAITSAEPEMGIAHILRDAGLTSITSEAIRMIKQGAVRIDNERIDDPKLAVAVGQPPSVYQVGKRRFARVTLAPAEE